MQATITQQKLKRYFLITNEALKEAKAAFDAERKEKAEDFFDMASRYFQDALFFMGNGEYVDAFAALNYAHGWLDAGARLRLFKVNNSRLFATDGK